MLFLQNYCFEQEWGSTDNCLLHVETHLARKND